MATGNMFQGMARGSVGDVTFSRSNGKQVSRLRNRNPKNPKTDSQMANRVLVSTLGKLYSQLSPVCNHSFEGLTTGMPNMQRFFKKNQSLLRTQLSTGVAIRSFAPKSDGANISVLGHEYVISEGSLIKPFGYVLNPNEVVVGIPVSTEQPTTLESVTVTYGDVCSTLGVQLGDQLTMVRFIDRVGNEQASDYGFAFNRIVLYPGGNWKQLYEEPAQVPFATFNSQGGYIPMLYPNERNLTRNMVNDQPGEVEMLQIIVRGDETFQRMQLYIPLINPYTDDGAPIYAVILSRKDGSTYRYSNAVLEYNDAYDDLLTNAIANNLVYTLPQAIETWRGGDGISAVSEDYLDNALADTGIPMPPIVPGGDANNG